MLTVYWSPLAEETYGETLDYLSQEWGNLSVIKFMDKVDEMLIQISRYPYMYKASQAHPAIRKGFVTKPHYAGL